MQYKLALSILTADFLNLGADIRGVLGGRCGSGIGELHLDVCDGNFVPSLSFGEATCREIFRGFASPGGLGGGIHVDTHLMIANPGARVGAYLAGGCNSLIFHLEAELHPLRVADQIRRHENEGEGGGGVDAGIALAPVTPAGALEPIHDAFQRILVMSVNPGYGGQELIPAMLRKVERIRALVGDSTDIVIDGGINIKTIASAKSAGANIFVVGSAVMQAPDRQESIENLSAALKK